MARDDMGWMDEPARTEQLAQGAIHDLWKGKPIEECELAELDALVDWVNAELQDRKAREAKDSVRSPF